MPIARPEIELRANIEQFSRAMNRLERTVDRSFKRLERKMDRIGRRFESVGRRLSASITLPLIAIAGGATKMAAEFDFSLNKINSLVGISKKQIALWREEILKLAPLVGKGPKELADALFFITSAGLRGTEAFDALTAAAQAAVSGLGDTAIVADAVTSAMNAYGKENLSSADATGVLVAVVREGKEAADALAGSFGKVISDAKNLGVSFRDVGAAIAAQTRVGIKAQVATTQLRALFVSLRNPSTDAANAMLEMGTSAEELRKKIQQDGLLKFLVFLKELMNKNSDAFARAFPNVRAMSGILAIVGQEAELVAAIFRALAIAGAADLNRAFGSTQQQVLFKFTQRWGKLQAIMIEFGGDTTPLVLEAVDRLVAALSRLSEKFQGLEQRVQTNIVKWLAFAALGGPVLLFTGLLISALSSIVGGVRLLSGALLLLLANPVVAFAVALGVALGGLAGFLLATSGRTDQLAAAEREHEKVLRRIVKLTEDATKASGDRKNKLIQERDALRALTLAGAKQELEALKALRRKLDSTKAAVRRNPGGRPPISDLLKFGRDDAQNISRQIAELERFIALAKVAGKPLLGPPAPPIKARPGRSGADPAAARLGPLAEIPISFDDPVRGRTEQLDSKINRAAEALSNLENDFLRATGNMRALFNKMANERIENLKLIQRQVGKTVLSDTQMQEAIGRINTIRDANIKGLEEQITVADRLGDSLNQAFQNAILQAQRFSDVLRSVKNLLISSILFGPEGQSGLFGGALSSLAGSLGKAFTFGGSASGGAIQPGLPRLVGERGPEIIVPKVPSSVLTAADTRRALGGGQPIIVNQTVNMTPAIHNTIRAEVFNAMAAAGPLAAQQVMAQLRGIR